LVTKDSDDRAVLGHGGACGSVLANPASTLHGRVASQRSDMATALAPVALTPSLNTSFFRMAYG
jgi:hypothetical protein